MTLKLLGDLLVLSKSDQPDQLQNNHAKLSRICLISPRYMDAAMAPAVIKWLHASQPPIPPPHPGCMACSTSLMFSLQLEGKV
jgi:hypothetical protein